MRNTLNVTTPSDREIALTRTFAAPRRLVWDAYTKPELLQRWMGVMEGWSWAECAIDLRVGGTYRYLWKGPGGAELGVRGVFREVTPPARLVSTERFDQAWYEGDALGTVLFVENDGQPGPTTTLTMTLLYDSKEVRDGVLRSPMAEGVGAGFDTLDEILKTL